MCKIVVECNILKILYISSNMILWLFKAIIGQEVYYYTRRGRGGWTDIMKKGNVFPATSAVMFHCGIAVE